MDLLYYDYLQFIIKKQIFCYTLCYKIMGKQGKYMKNVKSSISLLLLALSLSACSTTAPVIKSPNYTLGEQDGCATANGNYTKNSDLFKTDPDYESGWFAGRRDCNPSFHKK